MLAFEAVIFFVVFFSSRSHKLSWTLNARRRQRLRLDKVQQRVSNEKEQDVKCTTQWNSACIGAR